MTIPSQVSMLGDGPLTERGLREHIWPLFSRVLNRKEIYLANHSLGRPLDQMTADIQECLDVWYADMDEAWGPWMIEMDRFRTMVADLIGAEGPKSIFPKTSAGQGLRAVLNSMISTRPISVAATRGEFDSIDFILKVYEEMGFVKTTWIEADSSVNSVGLFDSESILAAIKPGIDLVVVSQVVFGTGQIIPGLEKIVKAAHAAGSMVLVDAYHGAGVVPMSFVQIDADFMIGGSYKYTRGGTGACWLAINQRHKDLRTLDTGWFAKRDPFSYERPQVPEYGDSWLESTPPVLPFYQARSGLQLTLALGVDRLRAYSLQQQECLRQALVKESVPVEVPQDPEQFGAFVLMPSKDGKAQSQRLKSLGVNTDSRGNIVRFGPDILNSEHELKEAARIVARDLSV